MAIIAVPGGLGDLGQLVVKELLSSGKHEVYIFTRKLQPDYPTQTSPVTGKEYQPLLQADYASELALSKLFSDHSIDTVLSMVSLDFEDVAQAQLRMIRAAASTSCVKRFMPSEFNVDYDLDDAKLPYPEKKFHTIARRELEKTSLEYTYVYPGMFMDYYGMPYFPTHMRPLYGLLDIKHNVAAIPGDGETYICLSYTKDVARYIAAAVLLETWPKVLTIVGSRITPNQLVALSEKIIKRKLNVRYDSLEDLREHKFMSLPSNEPIAVHFPGGMAQVSALVADLNASMGTGAYDLDQLDGAVDLVKAFEGKVNPMMSIEEFMTIAWEGR